ncbi:MAG TPA: substrate-binding domain-containing protein, partial [Planctomycetota bacterium]|nr:substrate-binding domain-containing protein [Planctomycetota bacterium]
VFALARMAPVLAVRKTNPKGIRSVDDLLRPDVKLSLPNPDAAAAGTLFREALRKTGRWEAVEKAAAVLKPTVNDVGNDLRLGAVDAGILWDALLSQVPEAETVPLPELAGVEASVSAGVLRSSADPAAALRLARWLAAPDRGGREFAAAGFRPSGGDAWEDRPRLVVHAGAMLRPGLERTIAEFEAREGVEVVTTYNGCGILVAQMKAGERPDLYFACDASFMTMVKDLYETPVDVTLNQLVILVKKGNPHGIRRLRDLARPGLRVGVGNEKQCALGELTQTALREEGVRADVERNIVVRTPAGDMLANQMRVGSLDAAVTYLSNATGAGDTLEAVPVDLPCALATQPVAVGKASPRKALASRLVEAFLSPASRGRFEAWGFRWKVAR